MSITAKSLEDIQRIFEAYQKSGQSLKKFAASRNIRYQTLLWYKKRLKHSLPDKQNSGFVQLVSSASSPISKNVIEVEFKKLIIRVNENLSKESLAGLIQLIQDRHD